MTTPRPRRILTFAALPVDALFRWDYREVPLCSRVGASQGPFQKKDAERFRDVNDPHWKLIYCAGAVRVIAVRDRVDREAERLAETPVREGRS